MLKTKTRTILLTLVTLIILSFFITVFVLILKNPNLPEGSVSFIFAINIITIILIFFLLLVLVIKSIIRLIYQRRQNILGSKLKMKLVVIMLILVIVPTVPTYVLVGPLINNIFGVWTQKRFKDALDSSIGISRSYLKAEEDFFLFKTESFVRENSVFIHSKLQSTRHQDKAREVLRDLEIEECYISDLNGVFQFEYTILKDPAAAVSNKEAYQTKINNHLKDPSKLPSSEVQMDRMKLVLYYPLEQKSKLTGVLVISQKLDPQAFTDIRIIEQTFTDFHNLVKFGKRSYPFFLNISFLIVSLVLLFLTLWIAFYLARQITIPVEALLLGTEKVSQGDLDTKIDVQTTDELGILVESFNNMVRDIKELNKKNEEHSQFITSILENISAGVIAINPDRKVIEINESARSLLKIEDQQSRLKLQDYFEKENFDLLDPIITESLKFNQEILHRELNLNIRGKNHNFHFSFSSGIESLEGGVIIVFDDITHIIHLQKIEVWRDVATQLAHEIKNPLTPIKLSTQRVLKKYKEGAEDFGDILQRSYSTIIQEVDNIKALVDHFNSFAKLPTPNLESMNLNEIINEVVDLYRTQENVKIFENYASNIPELQLDKFQIKRVMKNLIDNSIESFLKKGKIDITTRLDEEEKVVIFLMEDNGKGMEKDELDRVFLPYFSTKEKGMGLGMAIVEKIISDHNGQIEIFSQPYKGTTILIKFFYES